MLIIEETIIKCVFKRTVINCVFLRILYFMLSFPINLKLLCIVCEGKARRAPGVPLGQSGGDLQVRRSQWLVARLLDGVCDNRIPSL